MIYFNINSYRYAISSLKIEENLCCCQMVRTSHRYAMAFSAIFDWLSK